MATLKKNVGVILAKIDKKINGAIVSDPLNDLFVIFDNLYQHEDYEPYHLYFLSDDKVKSGDWCYFVSTKEIMIAPDGGFATGAKKIVASTDKSLGRSDVRLFCRNCNNLHSSNDGLYCDVCRLPNNPYLKDLGHFLPQPPDEFVHEFVRLHNNGNIVTNVTIEYNNEVYGNAKLLMDSIPKVNSKDNTVIVSEIVSKIDKKSLNDLARWMKSTNFNIHGHSPEDCVNRFIYETTHNLNDKSSVN